MGEERGERNEKSGRMEQTGHPRSINRQKFSSDEIRQRLATVESNQRIVFDQYRRLLAIRRQQKAFHPDGGQRILPLQDPRILGFERTSPDKSEQIFVLANFSEDEVLVPLSSGTTELRDLLSGKRTTGSHYQLAAYEIAWLS